MSAWNKFIHSNDKHAKEIFWSHSEKIQIHVWFIFMILTKQWNQITRNLMIIEWKKTSDFPN